jgi:2,4-dienoyl-CoA reductase-like NADH-dependent reductase (Old Yellow Enzyme family)/NADPH-dependent 2,4-dienoyl-CoA reductase/sulfur reductase-like enzyme
MLSPYTVKKTVFKNRVLASPITANRVVDRGYPTPEGIDAYETKSRGGFAQVTLTESFVDDEYALRHEHGLDVYSKNMSTIHIEAIETLTEAIKAHGAVASIQINHVGNVNHPDTVKGHKNPIGPSAFVRPDGVAVDEMDESMMRRVAANFASTALNCKCLGFDMVMLHGGHGWLLSQFISPLSNHRTDAYGGSLENRAKFPIMVLDAVRAAVGDDFLIEYRVSGEERVPGGMGLEETIEFCRLIQDRVDLIHVTAGIYHSHVETKAFSSMFDAHGCNLGLAAAIKKNVRVPVVAVGGFNSPEQIEEAISSGQCDFVALGRQQFADPDFVNKTLMGREAEIAPCLRCSCFNPLASDPEKRVFPQLWHCAVNPWSGRELRWRNAPRPVSSKKVLVVGGGVGGMYAAITAAQRGHDVTLVEKGPRLGGSLWFTDIDEHKESLQRFRDSLVARLERNHVKVLLNTTADAGYVEECAWGAAPDALIIAVGSSPVTPPIEGIENAMHVLELYRLIGDGKMSRDAGEKKEIPPTGSALSADADAKEETAGIDSGLPADAGAKEETASIDSGLPACAGKAQEIALIGGGLIGCETGLWLADHGYKVTVIELRGDLAIEANDSHRRALLPRLKAKATCVTGAKVTKIEKGRVHYIDSGQTPVTKECDLVVYAVGQKPDTGTVSELSGIVPWTVAIGDCKNPGQVKQATYDGFCAGMDIL